MTAKPTSETTTINKIKRTTPERAAAMVRASKLIDDNVTVTPLEGIVQDEYGHDRVQVQLEGTVGKDLLLPLFLKTTEILEADRVRAEVDGTLPMPEPRPPARNPIETASH